MIERVKTGIERDNWLLLGILTRQIVIALHEIDKISSKKKLKQAQDEINEAITPEIEKHLKNLIRIHDAIALLSIFAEHYSLSSAIKSHLFSMPEKDRVLKLIRSRPLSLSSHRGELLLEPFIMEWQKLISHAINNKLLQAWGQGLESNELIKAINGTKENQRQDGIIGQHIKSLCVLTRTSIQHANTIAKEAVCRVNDDVIVGERIVAVLDHRTSALCRSLDSEVYPVGMGPRPPFHPNCRTTTIPVFDKNNDYSPETYYEWLTHQPEKIQNLALGKARAKLFRDGGLTLQQFKSLQLDKHLEPMRLKDIREVIPEIFDSLSI